MRAETKKKKKKKKKNKKTKRKKMKRRKRRRSRRRRRRRRSKESWQKCQRCSVELKGAVEWNEGGRFQSRVSHKTQFEIFWISLLLTESRRLREKIKALRAAVL